MAEGTPFLEAIEVLRRRLNLSEDDFRRIWTEAGAIADAATSTVPGAIVTDLVRAIAGILEQGGTLADFRRDYLRIVAAAGWSYKGNAGWHSQLLWRLHTGEAYSAGRWEQGQTVAARHPERQWFGRYVTVHDDRVRPNHAAWHGIVLPLGHGFWTTHWTPNGFNCRCHVQVISDRDLRDFGWVVTPDSDPRLLIPPDPGWDHNPGVAGERLKQVLESQSH